MNKDNIHLNFKIGIIKELYKQEFLTKEQMERIIEILKQAVSIKERN